MSEYPLIEYVAKAIAIADGQSEEDAFAYEELAIAAAKAIKEYMERNKK